MHDIIPTDHEVIFHKPSVIIRIEQDEDGHLFSLSFRFIQVLLREEKDGGPYFLSLFSHDLHAVFSFTSMINLFQLFGFPFLFVYGYGSSTTCTCCYKQIKKKGFPINMDARDHSFDMLTMTWLFSYNFMKVKP